MTLSDCAGCGQVFMGEGARCSVCEAKRDPLECAECGTRLLVAVPKGLCGFCGDYVWDPETVAVPA